MTTFHQLLGSFIVDVEKFLVETLKKDKLCAASNKHKKELLSSIECLRNNHPQLFSIADNTRGIDGSISEKGEDTANAGGSGNTDEDPDTYSDTVPLKYVHDLVNPACTGHLEKKKKKGMKQFQKRWCVVHGSILYYFDKKKVKQQLGAIILKDYEFRDAPHLVKDASKKELSFELVYPGKRDFQFLAPSKPEYENWKKAITAALEAKPDPPISEDLYEDPVVTSGDNDIVETDEFYNDIENTTKDTSEVTSDEVYNDIENTTKDTSEVTSDEVYNDIDNVQHAHSEVTTDEIYNDIENTKNSVPLEEDDELYDDIAPVVKKRPVPEIPNTAPPPVPVRNNKDRPLPTSPTEKSKLAYHPKEDFENLFYGKWDCAAGNNKELSFKQGEIIHIINRGHDKENWWVGELKGTIGLVPKTYLTAAYEAVPQKI